MRDTKLLTTHAAKLMREAKEKILFKTLRKEVNAGANGTQEYVIKKGENTGKVAKNFQKSE
jgi:ribosomal protein S7